MAQLRLETILVPTDFSRGAAAAVEYACWLATRSRAKLVFAYVMEPTVYSVDFALSHPDISAEVRRGAMEALGQLVAEARERGIDAEHALLTGTPFVEIEKVASDRKADLIVMGTHGRTGLAHLMLGSTAERVVRLAPCPVLTVKASPEPTAEKATPQNHTAQRGARSAGR
jgi:nucleotide-binding universal stress UspA family protein